MKLVLPPLDVEKDEGFQNDLFDRKQFGEALRNIVTNSSGELVISLDGQWGEGKTTFIRMWQGLLNDSLIPNIYIDAFANDYVDDAFIAVASIISEYAETHVKDEKVVTDFKAKAKDVGGRLLSWSVKLGVKAATLGLIRESEIRELQDIQGDVAQGANNLLESFIADHLDSHSNDLKLIESFREYLANLPQQITPENPKSLVIIIDELDRCKPIFAVDLIEKIKHLFSVQNIVFVLAMNKEQLEESIKCIYGNGIDAQLYLQKFIHIETTIPKRKGENNQNDLHIYSKRLIALHELEAWDSQNHILTTIDPLAEYLNLSLRQLEKVFTNISIICASSAPNDLKIMPIIVFISVVKVTHTKLHRGLLSDSISYEEVCSELNMTPEFIESQSRVIQRLMSWIKFSLISDEEYSEYEASSHISSEFRGMDGGLWNHGLERRDVLPYFLQRLNMFNVN